MVAALSVRACVRASVRPSVRASVRHTFVRSISLKRIEGNLMKLDTLIEGHEENCRMQDP